MIVTKRVKIGKVFVGGGAPVSIQSMTNTKTHDVDNTVKQINELAFMGCDIVRCAVPDKKDAYAISEIKKHVSIPIVADIHYDYKLALLSIENGADKIRINPGNIGSKEALKEIAYEAKKANIPIRVGVNGGSLEKDILNKFNGVTPLALVESALRNIELMESFDFHNIVVSIKTSDVKMNYDAHKILSTHTDYPLHIGITEAGVGERAIIKSSIGIGSLLLEGIGDTVRVSLTGDPKKEIEVAKGIFSSLGLRKGSVNIISCPTCGRTEVDLSAIAMKVKQELESTEMDRMKSGKPSITVAVMGCSVNGPGEAKDADFGVACGNGKGVIFKNGEILETVDENDIVKRLTEIIDDI